MFKVKDPTKKSVSLNAILNVIRSALKVLFPLITFPYASRVLGAENIGKVDYSNSIVQYFVLLAALGISTYAIREGSKIRNDKKKFQAYANEIFTINSITTFISCVCLVVLTCVSVKLHDYSLLIAIQGIVVFVELFGMEWMNSIFEDYLYIAVRSVLSHLVSIVLLFVFVRTADDYVIYAGINVLVTTLICMTNFFYCRRYCKVRLTAKPHFFTHIKPMLLLFANNCAITIYSVADRTMLGYMTTDFNVGLYAVSVKVYNVLKSMISAIMMVVLPRLSFYYGNNMQSEYKKLLTNVASAIALLSLPCMMGVMTLAEPIVYLLSGEEYMDAVLSLQILSVGVVLTTFGYIFYSCILIPTGKDKKMLLITSISAAINILLNFVFIPLWKQNGAAVTTLISECMVLVLSIIFCGKVNDFLIIKTFVKNVLQGAIGAVIVFCMAFFCKIIINNYIGYIVAVMFSSIILYFIALLLLKNSLLKHFISIAVKKLNKRKRY